MDASVFGNFIYSQLFVSLPYPTQDCTGKTVIVTGSNTGLGLEAARHFARLNAAKLILGVRDLAKGEAARKSILESTRREAEAVEVWKLDLGSYASVEEFADKVKGLERVDIVVENAGIAPTEFTLVEGDESTITVNVISTFLLAFLLLPALRSTAEKISIRPTLTIVSSEVHAFTSFKERNAAPTGQLFAHLADKDKANMSERYLVSKLLEVFAVREFAKRHPADEYPVTLNMLNPGFCHSELAREPGLGMKVMKMALARTTEVGSRCLVDAGTRGKESHGEYLSDCRVMRTSKLVMGEEGPAVQKRVWEELCVKLETVKHGVTDGL